MGLAKPRPNQAAWRIEAGAEALAGGHPDRLSRAFAGLEPEQAEGGDRVACLIWPTGSSAGSRAKARGRAETGSEVEHGDFGQPEELSDLLIRQHPEAGAGLEQGLQPFGAEELGPSARPAGRWDRAGSPRGIKGRYRLCAGSSTRDRKLGSAKDMRSCATSPAPNTAPT